MPSASESSNFVPAAVDGPELPKSLPVELPPLLRLRV
jgi:hypothetical protein